MGVGSAGGASAGVVRAHGAIGECDVGGKVVGRVRCRLNDRWNDDDNNISLLGTSSGRVDKSSGGGEESGKDMCADYFVEYFEFFVEME